MSIKYKYFLVFKGSNRPYWQQSYLDTLHDQQQAFDELRKRVAVDCDRCHGIGIDTFYFDVEESLKKCHRCQGETQLCAYCSGHSGSCECGS